MKYAEEAVCAILDLLNKNEIPYMLVGSFSSNAYGEARSTKDADFVVQMSREQRQTILAGLPAEFEADPQARFETITGHTRQLLMVPSIPFEIELYDLSNEPFDQTRFARRVRTQMLGRTVWLPSAEDVVIQKLRWSKRGNRLKDLVDAQGILKVRADQLDWTHMEHWCAELDLMDELEKLRKSI